MRSVKESGPVLMGRILSVYGVKGWLKIHSDTEPKERILNYPLWLIGQGDTWRKVALTDGRCQGKGLVAQLAGCDDRDQAMDLVGLEIAVGREQLPELSEGEYYWFQLEGLDVINLAGANLGRIRQLMSTAGANDVLVVESTEGSIDQQERLIPYVMDVYIKEVLPEQGVIRVDWDSSF